MCSEEIGWESVERVGLTGSAVVNAVMNPGVLQGEGYM
jgi:hypothetical protein